MAGNFTSISNMKKRAFLIAYAGCGHLHKAAEIAGCSVFSHYKWKPDPQYWAAFLEAREMAADRMESEAMRRAFAGSDLLLIFLLKGARPETYRDNVKHEITGKDGEKLVVTLKLNNEDAGGS